MKITAGIGVALAIGGLTASAACNQGKPSSAGENRDPEAQGAKPVALTAAAQDDGIQDGPKTKGTCEQCRARFCTDYQRSGVDVVSGCLKAANTKLVASPDAEFVRDCTAVVECAIKHNCAYDPARGPVQCYCGSNTVDTCKDVGPAADAPCVAEWQKAARTTANMDVLLRFDQVAYASGWAFNLLECDRDYCNASSRWGRCTP